MAGARRNLTISVLAAEAVLLTGCGAAMPEERIADVERKSVALTDYPQAVDALRSSAYRLGADMLSIEPEANQVASPVSALSALAMLRVGARTTTAAEMDAALGLPPEHRDEAMNALLSAWAAHDGDPASVDDDEPPVDPLMHLANGLFVADDLKLADDFLPTLAEHYGAGAYPVDYGGASALEAMNAWVNHHTGGRIEEVPIEPTPATRLNIINTVYFAAAWAEPFAAEDTEEGAFFTNSGRVQAPMMRSVQPLRHVEGTGWQGVDLPYNNGFVMRLVLPAVGNDVVPGEAELVEMNGAFDGAAEVLVSLTLPAWDHNHEIDLKEMLTAMGLEEAMGPAPDFSGIGPVDLFVEGAAQAANITVAEKGTVAAAVTQIAMAEGGPPEPEVELTFDRPFLYQILHEDTGMPIFLGTVMDPSTE
jgi:serpin B